MKHKEQHVSDVLKAWLTSNQLKPRLHQHRIAALWADLMGPNVTHYTRSIRIDNRILYLEISSAPLRNELFNSRLQIIAKVNEALGDTYITDTVIR